MHGVNVSHFGQKVRWELWDTTVYRVSTIFETKIWDQFQTIFTRNNHQFSICHTFILSGCCSVLEPTALDRERCLAVERNKMNNYKPLSSIQRCFHRPNKRSIRALIGSRNHSVTSTVESSLPTKWWVIGRDLDSQSRERWQAQQEDFGYWFY